MSLVKELQEQLSRSDDDRPGEFVEQVNRIRDFKKKLDEAGVVIEPETLPDPMTLIGHFARKAEPA